MRAWIEEDGRDPTQFGTELLVPLDLSPDEFARLVDTWRDADLTYITLHLFASDLTPRRCVDVLDGYMKALR